MPVRWWKRKGKYWHLLLYINTWKDTNFEEIVAILLLIVLRKHLLFDLDCSNDNFIEMSGFRQIMTGERFLRILSFFYLSNRVIPKRHKGIILSMKRLTKSDHFLKSLCHFGKTFFILKWNSSMNRAVNIPASETDQAGPENQGLGDAKTGYMYN